MNTNCLQEFVKANECSSSTIKEGVLEILKQLRKAVSIVEIKRKKTPELTFFCSPMGGAPRQSGWLQKEKNPRSRLAMRILEFCPLHLDALPFCLNEGYL